ncbi:MAG: hypothetical protein K2Q24_15885 [Chitinophagaceae bacterium]|nr:hypothetical protein [Chitinophagaceae bacterium]
MKDTRTILLLVVSLCLVGTWVYHLYDKNKYAAVQAVVIKKDTTQNQAIINDSLRLNYVRTLSALDSTRTGKDSLYTALTGKLTEIDSLRNEISGILNINNITREDLRRAEEKIRLLQQKMSVASKNGNETKVSFVNNSNESVQTNPQQQIKTSSGEKPEATPSYLTALNISFKAMQGKEQVTGKATAADYFSISCSLQNSSVSFPEAEVFMVLTDPGGNVVQDDQWEAGLFQSKNGRMPYTRKQQFSYTKGESKKLNLQVKLPAYDPGAYSIQIYHNGLRIGKADVQLN